MTEIIPAIIPTDLKIANEQLESILGAAKKVQIDFVDGVYAPVRTWPFIEKNSNDLFEMARGKKSFPHISDFAMQMDLMVLHPIEYISDLIDMGAKSFVIHVDSTDHVRECMEMIKNLGCEAGLGLRPSVDFVRLEPYLSLADFVQFMGNDRLGHSGVDLDHKAVEKIGEFHETHPSMPIQIDIGVSEETIPLLKKSGVTSFVSGSAVFGYSNPKEALQHLKNL